VNATANFIALDLGASSGRVLAGQWDGARFELEELHRFTNGPADVLGHLYWDVLGIWSEIKAGLCRYAAGSSQPLSGIGADTWGVDFALLDRRGQLLGNPFHYRDSRTDGMLEKAFQRAPRARLYGQTGNQFMQINTLYQLLSMTLANDPQLEMAETLLMMPDLFHYWLAGTKTVEYTIASTSQMLDANQRRWATDLLYEMDIPSHFLPDILPPGTVLADLRPEVCAEAGLRQGVPVIATGSHDTANAIAAIPDLDERSLYISSGTWSLMGVEVYQPIVNDQAMEMNFTNEGGLGGTITFLKNIPGLWLLQESRRQWGREGRAYEWDELLALAEEAAPLLTLVDPDAPDFLSPGDMPASIRAYCRSTGQPAPESAGAVVRTCLESLALKTRQVLGDLQTVTRRRLEVIRMVGGGSQNGLLCQFTADACGRPVIAGPVEATALGNIMVQAVATGHLASLAEGRRAIAASIDRRSYEPHPGPAWDEAYARFIGLIRA
jgi:rhamnulokinase